VRTYFQLESFQPTVVAMATTFGQRRVFTVMFIYLVVVSFYAIVGQVLFGDVGSQSMKSQ
jgi:hypothetical protein